MIILQAQHLTKRFNGVAIFEDLNLTINDHSHLGLVGQNGAGKSTLLKMLVDPQTISSGTVTTKQNLSIGYLPQNTGLHSDRTIQAELELPFKGLQEMETRLHQLEDQMSQPEINQDPDQLAAVSKTYDQLQADFTRNNGYGYHAEIRTIMSAFGFSPADQARPISELSGGQQTRVALAKLLLEKPDLLLLDEPTNHIDMETTAWLENFLKSYAGAFLIISHDRYFLDQTVTGIYELDHGHLNYYAGNYSFFVTEKEHQLTLAAKKYEKQQHQIKKDEEFIQKNLVRASTTKRAQSRQKQLAKLERVEKPSQQHATARFHFQPARKSGEVVLDVENLGIGYHQELSYPINLHLRRQQRVAIFGPNGVGKSTLLKTIVGELPPLQGTIRFGTGVQIGYYDQQQARLHPEKDVLHELWDDYPTTPEGDIRSILGSFLFSGAAVEKQVANLSGGERARLLLTKLSMERDNFLVLDEPTNHLDVDSINVLEKALLAFQGTILFVSHDRYFINKLATHIVELSAAGSTTYMGNYDYYRAKKAEEAEIAAHEQPEQPVVTAPASDQKQQFQRQKDIQRQQRKLARTIQDLETQLGHLETQIQSVQTAMTKPENYQDANKSSELQTQLNELQATQQTVESQWETASLDLETLDEP
ncbi:ABC-F family ATP-binding cassette domain-containing protein [Fructilactobacillus myrtifloralis]|uniref:ABC-F family ATP-binding cassette domain-containing protein n=1 Tax=Fructilactobacillus myrtifloralis TaxID=2940301 RepID=A0ABY5BQS2_9LACO|nr:ABC-F family ATP-binding cassette domain-containing protein [Fructilactobacillus myrtifloralis]USS84941.1 ABC-F family ATP-binding cassette domain-containing protein [Fructilactobacillus myrtifloralis]